MHVFGRYLKGMRRHWENMVRCDNIRQNKELPRFVSLHYLLHPLIQWRCYQCWASSTLQTISFFFFSHEKRLLGWGLNDCFGVHLEKKRKKNTASLCFSMSTPATVSNTLYKAVLNRAGTWTSWRHCQLPVAYGLAARRDSRKLLVPTKKK